MMVRAKFSALQGILFHEWALRFVFGGLCSIGAGLIAQRFGPAAGGLFLAFPAIFPAGASLVAAHEQMHKARAGFDGTNRGRAVAAVDAAGAAIGCIGLAGFALVLWMGLPHMNVCRTLLLASFSWLALSVGLWLLRKSRGFRS